MENIIGLLRGTVRLEEHRAEWEALASETVTLLKKILGGDAADVQHVGSTAIRNVPAKPILDLAVAVRAPEDIFRHNDELAAHGILFRGEDHPGQWLYVMGDFERDTRTHHIHVVLSGSPEWENYRNFRDYLNDNAAAAAEYAALKRQLAASCACDRKAYTAGKSELVSRLLTEAAAWRRNASECL